MIDGKKVLGIIPARGGSKGIPRKNIRILAGKPLIAWTIEAAKKSKYIDRVILSSEDEEIIRVAKEWGCEVPFVRPVELANDDVPGIGPILHAIDEMPGFDLVVKLQPTSPLRLAEDIDRCIETCVLAPTVACVSVTEADKSPYWMYSLDGSGRMFPLLPRPHGFECRQTLPKVYSLNGSVYVAEIEWLIKHGSFLAEDVIAYVMPTQRSIDIDTEMDLILCEALLETKEGILSFAG